VLDRSRSMEGLEHEVNVVAGGLADALHQVGCPVMVVGFTSFGGEDPLRKPTHAPTPVYGFTDAVVHLELYKDWTEPMSVAVWSRVARKAMCGGTPMGHGVEVALRGLRTSADPHRVVIVITDGMPDDPEVVRRQQRVAAEAGIIVIGVEVSEAPEGVEALFEHALRAPGGAGLAGRLVKVLESIVFSAGMPVGRFA